MKQATGTRVDKNLSEPCRERVSNHPYLRGVVERRLRAAESDRPFEERDTFRKFIEGNYIGNLQLG
jgi:hypothetical protein